MATKTEYGSTQTEFGTTTTIYGVETVITTGNVILDSGTANTNEGTGAFSSDLLLLWTPEAGTVNMLTAYCRGWSVLGGGSMRARVYTTDGANPITPVGAFTETVVMPLSEGTIQVDFTTPVTFEADGVQEYCIVYENLGASNRLISNASTGATTKKDTNGLANDWDTTASSTKAFGLWWDWELLTTGGPTLTRPLTHDLTHSLTHNLTG